MSVFAKPGDGVGIAITFPDGVVQTSDGLLRAFRLVIGRVELEERFGCVSRRFVSVGETAE